MNTNIQPTQQKLGQCLLVSRDLLVILQIFCNSCLYNSVKYKIHFHLNHINHALNMHLYHCLLLKEEKGSDNENDDEDEKSATNSENTTSNSSVSSSR